MWTVGLRRDICPTPELLPCESSGCHTGRVSPSVWRFFMHSGNFGRVSSFGQELIRGEIRIFRYEMGGTWVFTVLLPCGGQFLHFPHVNHTVPWCKRKIAQKVRLLRFR